MDIEEENKEMDRELRQGINQVKKKRLKKKAKLPKGFVDIP